MNTLNWQPSLHSSMCVSVCSLFQHEHACLWDPALCCLRVFFIVCLRIICWSLRRRPACRNQWFGCRMQVCSTAAACGARPVHCAGFFGSVHCCKIDALHLVSHHHAPQLSGTDVRVLCHLERDLERDRDWCVTADSSVHPDWQVRTTDHINLMFYCP